jgi:hypothetical protein
MMNRTRLGNRPTALFVSTLKAGGRVDSTGLVMKAEAARRPVRRHPWAGGCEEVLRR